MNKPLIERLKKIRKKLNMNQTEFAASLDMKQSSYSSIETYINPLTDKNISLICLKHGVSEKWLRTGEGEMMNKEVRQSGRENRLLELFRQLSSRAQDLLIEYAEKLLSDEKTLRSEAEKREESG